MAFVFQKQTKSINTFKEMQERLQFVVISASSDMTPKPVGRINVLFSVPFAWASKERLNNVFGCADVAA